MRPRKEQYAQGSGVRGQGSGVRIESSLYALIPPSPRRPVTGWPGPLVILSPCHLVTASPHHLVTLSPCHLVILSLSPRSTPLFAPAYLCYNALYSRNHRSTDDLRSTLWPSEPRPATANRWRAAASRRRASASRRRPLACRCAPSISASCSPWR